MGTHLTWWARKGAAMARGCPLLICLLAFSFHMSNSVGMDESAGDDSAELGHDTASLLKSFDDSYDDTVVGAYATAAHAAGPDQLAVKELGSAETEEAPRAVKQRSSSGIESELEDFGAGYDGVVSTAFSKSESAEHEFETMQQKQSVGVPVHAVLGHKSHAVLAEAEDEKPAAKSDKKDAAKSDEKKDAAKTTDKAKTKDDKKPAAKKEAVTKKKDAPAAKKPDAAKKKDESKKKEEPKKADAKKEEPKKADAKKKAEPKKADAKKADAKKADATKKDAASKKDEPKKKDAANPQSKKPAAKPKPAKKNYPKEKP